MKPMTIHATPARSRGVSLLVSLIFLVVLTLLGLTAARVAIMQERMAGNVRETNEAFQAAEATLREIEQRLQAIAQGGTGGLPVVPTWADISLNRNDCTLQSKAENDWTAWDSAPWQTAPTTGNDYLVVSISAVVESGGDLFQPPCLPISSADDTALDDAYIIVARATGPAATGDVIVQSIYYWP